MPALVPGRAIVRTTFPLAFSTQTVTSAFCESWEVSVAPACALAATVAGLSVSVATCKPDGGEADGLGVGVGDGVGAGPPALDCATKPRQTAIEAASVSRSVGLYEFPSK